MSLLDVIHSTKVHTRRVRVLADRLSALLPKSGRVLDIGCGDGLLASRILRSRGQTALRIEGIDIVVRGETQIPVVEYDGLVIPFPDASFDAVMIVDVLHHTDDPTVILREAMRVSRGLILVKDHTRNGLFAEATLRFMDRVGNARHGVRLPYNYWPRQKWIDAFATLELKIATWQSELGLYPFPASVLFGRSLHFIAGLRPEN